MKAADATLNSIANWFAQAVPHPTTANISVQLGCHFEEVREMIVDGLKADCPNEGVAGELLELANDFKAAPSNPEVMVVLEKRLAAIDRKELLDALCDQIVTAVGVAHMLGMNIQGGLDEVDRSNWSKFKDGAPVFDENGKIAKNKETYFKADMSAFV